MRNSLIRLVKLLLTNAHKILTPLLAPFYKNNINSCPEFILTALGIANVKYRPNFYTLDEIVNSIVNFDGSVVECGTYRGSTLLGIAHLLKKRGINVTIYGLDSFEGLPSPTEEDALENGTFHKKAQKSFFKDASYNELMEKIRKLGFSNQIVLLKGLFENTLPCLKNEKFKLVHLDCDLYQSYKICLEFLYERVLPRGYIVFDEYDYSKSVYPGAQKAIDEFLKDKPEKIQCLRKSKHSIYFIRTLYRESKYSRSFIRKL